jgi:hypothetical protein
MSTKVIYLCMFLGSIIGGYLPVLLGVNPFSYTSIIFGGIGSVAGLWVGYKLSN